MNFVAGVLLLVSNFAEQEAFAMFNCLMEDYLLEGFYRRGFPRLKKYMEAHESLSELYIPKVKDHFNHLRVPCYFLHQWYLTMFASSLPLGIVVVLWDAIIAEGLNTLLPLSVALLQVLSPFLLRMSFEEVLRFLKSLKEPNEVHSLAGTGRWLVRESEKIRLTTSLTEFVGSPIESDDAHEDVNVKRDERGQ
eukprot:GHVN01057144.1.p2 GENE.GHVN01057144.1~~GHVN01057144.1.p2  ORF type:complete len:193 (+),score=34.30 GHVN01057144.1:2294-2872(+)